MTLRELHLFAGIGGGILGGVLLGHECVAAVESNAYCQHVLHARQADGCLPKFPVFADVRGFDGRPWRGLVDVVCGGFPCQPWSTAGKQLGVNDPRHLWPEMARIIGEVRPTYVFAENVSLAAFAEPWRDLRGMGYRVPPALRLSASDLGAPHQRNRWWLLAADADRDREHAQPVDAKMASTSQPHVSDTDRPRMHKPEHVEPLTESWGEGATRARHDGRKEPLADSNRSRLEVGNRGKSTARSRAAALKRGWWDAEPPVGRVADGFPSRMGQLHALGNAQVPAVAAQAFRILMETHFK